MKARDAKNVAIVTLLSQDVMYQRLVAVWGGVGERLAPDDMPNESAPESLNRSMHNRWMWSRVEPEPEPLWAEAAGLPDAPHVRRAMRVLQENGAVFPDGTLSTWVEKFLAKQADRAGVEAEERDD